MTNILGMPECLTRHNNFTGVVILPTKTMHHCNGNLSKLPYICIVRSLENWWFNDPCFMNPGCFQSQLVLASTWKAILRHDVLSSGFAAWMFLERSASAKKALKHNIHAKKHLEVNICIMYIRSHNRDYIANPAHPMQLMGGLGRVRFGESRNLFLSETNWKLGSTPTIPNHICPQTNK